MTDKRNPKKDGKDDSREKSEDKVRAEVIEDLDVPQRDGDSLRGGATSTRPACHVT